MRQQDSGSSSGGGGGLDLDQSKCLYFLGHHIDEADLTGLGTVRAQVSASDDQGLGLNVPWPAKITVQVGDAPVE